jgi:hypothetical protein
VGFSLQSVAPRQGRAPLSRPHAPLQFSAAVPEVRCSRSHPPGSSRLPRLRVVRLAIPGARSPFPPRSRATSSTAWTPFTGTTPFPRLRLLRSLDPLANPYSRPPVARRPRADALLGFRPSRALSRPSLGPSHDPTDRYVRRGASAAPSRGATSRRQVRTLRPRGRVVLVGARPRGATARRRVPPLGGNPASLDLRPPPLVSGGGLVLGGVKDSYQPPISERWACSPGVSCLFDALATSRAVPTLAQWFAGGVSASSPRAPTLLRVGRVALAPLRRPSCRRRVGRPGGTVALM